MHTHIHFHDGLGSDEENAEKTNKTSLMRQVKINNLCHYKMSK